MRFIATCIFLYESRCREEIHFESRKRLRERDEIVKFLVIQIDVLDSRSHITKKVHVVLY